MSEVKESPPLGTEFTGVLGGSRSSATVMGGASPPVASEWRSQVSEFAKGAADMSVEFGKGVRDVVRQSVLKDDWKIARKIKDPCANICRKLRFMNEYLPEDRDPCYAWSVIACVCVFALAALIANVNQSTTPSFKKMKIHPASASLILLPDGRQLAYQEKGVSADQARHTMIIPHSFLSSRLAGIPGVKDSLLQEFGIRLLTYDLPGFGESDPHPGRNLESSALDMLHFTYAANVSGKVWIVGYSDGSIHAWSALRYIPDKIEGAIMVAPMVNPYDLRLNKEERRMIWGKWTVRKRIMYFVSRRFPKLLAYFYWRSFLSGSHARIDKWLTLSLGEKDRTLVEDPVFEEFCARDVEESVRQANAQPFIEEASLQVSDWGFSISDLKIQKQHRGKGILVWLKSVYNLAEERVNGFLGPIYVWQGGEDRVIPSAMSDFVHRVLPDVMLQRLPYEGHFTYFYFCDECHRQMLTTVYGNPQGPLPPKMVPIPTSDDGEESSQVSFKDTATDKDSVSSLS